jgi:hypothetical protein
VDAWLRGCVAARVRGCAGAWVRVRACARAGACVRSCASAGARSPACACARASRARGRSAPSTRSPPSSLPCLFPEFCAAAALPLGGRPAAPLRADGGPRLLEHAQRVIEHVGDVAGVAVEVQDGRVLARVLALD